MQPSETLQIAVTADTRDMEASLNDVGALARDFGGSMTRAFKGAVVGGKSFSQTLVSIGQSISRLALSAATKPLQKFLSSGFESLFSGLLGFSKGGVVGAPMPVPFAHGGVVSSPTFFPLNSRQTGLAGEAGPEAILPLRRGADGRLGVASSGAGQGMTINFNVTATDAESFRQSESQIAAMVQRALARGQRNL